jgi:hypothetical protein
MTVADKLCIGMLSVTALLYLYGVSVKNREYCVVCRESPPCHAFKNCKANNIEGYILKNTILKN